MNIYERRRANLLVLLESMSASELSKASGVAASSISSCLKRLPDGRFMRNIGEKTARNLEKGAKKPEGFLDTLPVKSYPVASETSSPYKTANKPPMRIEEAVETLRLALLSTDPLTRAQAKPIVDALFADPENSLNLGQRMATTLGFCDAVPGQSAAA